MMITFQQYLTDIGFQGTTREEYKKAHRSYRKEYQKQYLKKYRDTLKRVEILFSMDEYKTLQNMGSAYDEKPTNFIRKSSLAYLQSEIYLPLNKDIEEVKILIRKSSNDINNLVYQYRNHPISNEEFKQLIKQVNQIEEAVSELHTNPKVIFKPIHLIPNIHANKDDE